MIRQNKGSKKIRYVVKDSERQGRDQGRAEDRGLGARAALGSQRFSTATHTTRYGASATPAYESPLRTPTPGTVPREIRPTGGRWGATGGVAGASIPSVTGSWRDKQHGGLGRGRSPATGMASGQGLYRTTTGRDVFPATPGRSVYQPSRRTASPMRSTPDTRRGTPQPGQGDRMDGGFVLVQGEMEEMKRGRYGNFIRSSTPAHRVGTPDKHAPSAYSKSLNTPSFEPREAQKSRSADVITVRHSGITQRGFSTQPAPVATSTITTKDYRPKGAVSAELPLGTTTSMTESISEGYVVVPKTSDQESQAEDSSSVGDKDDIGAKEEDKPAKGEETKDTRAPHKRSWNEAIGTNDNAKEGTLAPRSKEVENSSKITDKDDKVGDGAKVEDRPTEREENKDNRDEVGAKIEDKPTEGQEDKDDRVGDGAKVEDKIKPTELEENKHNRDDVFAKDEDKPTEDPSSPHKRSWDEAIGTEDNAKEGTLETQTEEVNTVPDTIPSQAKAILVTPPPPQSKVKIRRSSSEEAPIPTDLPQVETVERQVEPPESLISQDVFKKNQHQVRALQTKGEEETCQTISPAPEKPPMPEDDVQVKPKASVVTPIHPPEVKTTTQLSSGTDTQSQPTVSYKNEGPIVGSKPTVHSQDVEAPATVPSGSQPTVSFVEGDDKLVEETVQPFHIKAKATVVPQDSSPTKVKVTRKSSLESQPLPEFQTIDKLECEVKPQEPLIKTDPLLKNQQQVKVQTTDEEEETLETFGPSGQKPERPADAVPSRAKASLVAPPACPDVTASVTPSAGEGQEPPRDNKQIGEQRPGQGSAHLPVLAGRPPVEDVTTFHHGSTLPYPSSDQPTMPTASQPLHGGTQLPPPPEGLISSPWQYNAGVGQPEHDPSYPPGAPCAPYPPGPAPYAPYPPGPAPYAPYPPGLASEAPHPSGAAPNAPYPPGRAPDAPYPPGRAPDAPYPPPPGRAVDAPYPPGRTPDVPYPPGRVPDAPYPPGRVPDAPYPPGRAPDAPYPPPPGKAVDAPYPPPPGRAPDAPYPPGRAPDAPYPPGRAPDAPYPPGRTPDAPYPPPPGRAVDAPYPPPPGRAPDAPCPPGRAPDAPYPPGRTPDAPYTPGRTPDAPYPPGRSPDAPYPPPPGRAPDAPCPPGTAPDAPYPSSTAPDAPYPSSTAPDAPQYPSGPAPYPPAPSPSPSPFYTPPGGAFPYPAHPSEGESRGQEQSSPGSPYPPPHPAFPQRHDPAFPPQLPQGLYPPYPPVQSVYPPQSPYDPYQPSQTTGHLPYPPAGNVGYPPLQPATHHPGQPAQTSQIGPERSSGEAQPDAFRPSVPLQPPPPIGLDFVSPPIPPVGQQPTQYDPTIRETDILSPPYTSDQRQQPFDGTVPPESRESTDVVSKPVDQLSSEELEKRRVSFETQNSKDIRHSAPMSPPDKAVLPWRPIEEIISPKPGTIPIPLPWTPSPTQSPEKQQAFDFGGASRRHVTVKKEIVEEECDHRQTEQQATGRICDTRESTDDVSKPVDQLSSEELEKRRVSFETQNSKDIRHSAPMSPPDKAVLPWRPIEEIISPKPGSIPIPLPWTPSPTQSPEKEQAFDFGGASRRHVTVRKEIVEEECDHRQTKQQATGRISDTRESTDDVNKLVNQLSSEEVGKRRVSFETQNSKDIRHSAPMSPPDKAVLPWRPIEEIISPRPGSIAIPLPWTPFPTQSPEKQQAFDFVGASRRHVTVKEEIVEEQCDRHQAEQPTTTLLSDTESGTLHTTYTFSDQDMPTEPDQITAEETQSQSQSQSDTSGQPGSVKAEAEYDDGVVPSGYNRHDKEKASKSKIPTPLGGHTSQDKQDTVREHTSQTKRPKELQHSAPMSPPDKAVLPWRPIEEIISPRQGSIPIPLPWTPTPSPEKQKAFDFSGASKRHVTVTEEITEQDSDLQTKQPPTMLISDIEPGALCTSYTLSEQDAPSESKQTPAEASEDQSKNLGQPGIAEADYQSGVVPSGYDTSPGKDKATTSKVKDDISRNREEDDLGPSSPEVEPLSPQQPTRTTKTGQYSSPMSPPNKAVLPWEPLENIISPRPGSIAIPLPWTPTASPEKQKTFEFGGATRKHVSVTEGVVEEDNDRWTKLPATTLVSDTETGALGSSYTLSDQDTEAEQTTTEVTEDQSTKTSQPVSAQVEDEYQAGVVPSGYDTSDKPQEPQSTAKDYTPKGMVQDPDDPSSPEVEPLSPYKPVRPTQIPVTKEAEGSHKRKFFPKKSESSSERTSSSEVEPVTPESPMSPPYKAVVVWRSREEILSPRISSVVIPLPWSPLPQSPTRVRQLNKKKATKREQGLVEGTTIFEEDQSMERLANVVDIPQREEVALSTAFVPSQPPNHGDVDNELNKQRAAAREPGLVEETTSFEADPRMTKVANVADVSPHDDVALATAFVSSQPPQHGDGDNEGDVFYDAPGTAESGQPAKQKPTRQSKIPTFQSKSPPPSTKLGEGSIQQQSPEQPQPEHSQDFSQQSPSSSKIPRAPSKVPTSPTRRADSPPPPSRTPKSPTRKSPSPSKIPGLAKSSGIPSKIPLKYFGSPLGAPSPRDDEYAGADIAGDVAQVEEHEREPRPRDEKERQDVEMVKEEVHDAGNLQQEPDQQRENQEDPDSGDGQKGSEDERERYEIPEDLERIDEEDESSKDERGYYGDDDAESDRSEGKGWRGRVPKKRSSKEDLLTTDEDKEFEEDVKTAASQRKVPPKTLDLGTSKTPTRQQTWPSPMSPADKALLLWKPREDILSPKPGSIVIPLPWSPTKKPPSPMTPRSRKRFHPPLRQLQKVLKENTLDVGPMPTASYLGVSIVPVTTHYIVTGFVFSEDSCCNEAPSPVEVHEQSAHSEDDSWVMVEESDDDMADLGAAGYTGRRQDDESFCEPPLSREEHAAVKRAVHATVQEFFGEEAEEKFY